MELPEIVEQWLKEHGYDGLCYPDHECGCGIGDLMPCGNPDEHCEAGYKRATTEEEKAERLGDVIFCLEKPNGNP